MNVSPSVRFWKKCDIRGADDCWNFSTQRASHPFFYFNGKMIPAYRFAWIEVFGPIPDGLCVRHDCDNGRCVNPLHLELGTQADNMKDCVSRDRQARGERNGHAVLTEDQVIDIRKHHTGRYGDGARLARRFGVSPQTICDIIKLRGWKHVPPLIGTSREK